MNNIILITYNTLFGKFLKQNTLRSLPELCESLNLKFTLDDQNYNFGTITGSYDGVEFELNITDASTFIFKLEKSNKENIDISTEKNFSRKEMFSTGNKKFDKLFKKRHADPEIVKLIQESAEFQNTFIKFNSTWKHKIRYISLNYNIFRCSFNYGYPFYNYFPAKALKNVLPEITSLVKTINHTLPRERV